MNIATINAVEFLLYSYYKLSLDDGDNTNRVIETAISIAFKDATNQSAFNVLKKEGSLIEAKEKARKTLLGTHGVIALLESGDKQSYDCLHDSLCKQLIDDYSNIRISEAPDKQAFTYGNAQKWVNMSIKNLYVIRNLYGVLEKENEYAFVRDFGEAIDTAKFFFHIPVDSFILQAVWDYLKAPIIVKTNKDGKKGKYSSDKVKPWSTWDGEDYKLFLTFVIGLSDCPIDWEGPEWIKQAKRKRKND